MATTFAQAHTPDRSPIAIRNFTKERYVSPGWMEREAEQLWATSWLVAGVAADVREPGQFITFDIGKLSVIVARGADGALRAMHNACTHRGTRLVTAAAGVLRKFVCPYHAWVYGLDGALESVPGAGRFSNGVPREELSLRPVEVGEALGLVFIRLTPGPLTLAEFLAPLAAAIGTYRLDLMDVTGDQSVSHLCNWKAIIDNFAELYHVPFLHPIHRRMFECTTAPIGLYDHGHTAVFVEGGVTDSGFPVPDVPSDMQAMQLEAFGLDPAAFRGRVGEIRPALQRAKRALAAEQGLAYADFTDAQLTDVWQFNLFPNVILSVTPESAWLMRSRPDAADPGRSMLDMITLVRFHGTPGSEAGDEEGERIGTHFRLNGPRPADYRRPERDSFTHEDILAGAKTMTVTIDEDISLLGRVQQGMASAGFDRVWLSDEECRVQHFHDALDRCLGAE
ncbi:aromatic ring-hydroxylating oxygenase subunit alpha [Porphyrobacter sp. AAP82]|uniref:aromatic ring-hydroxylating oxygenase subunit alpha n=1 Tax=Porphyrobacter sp. AAP82 TaxID=1248917 RepID=UPI000319C497|nr:aromatic ring-hydroxylating dioxygenase subunit alpha [Porphyrobacter sp. AAP82]